MFKPLALKISLFWPPSGPYNSNFYDFCSLLSLHCSFASLFVRSRPPSKNACGSSPVLILPPRPRLHKRLHASHPQFCNSRVLSDVFFVPAILYTHVFCIFSPFFTNLLPALGGEHDFESCMYVKSSKNVLLNTPSYTKSHRKTLSWEHLLQLKS